MAAPRTRGKGWIMRKRFLIAWIVIFIVWFFGSFVVHGVLLRSDYMQLTNLFRAEADERKYFHRSAQRGRVPG
jgi:hypothetical protein